MAQVWSTAHFSFRFILGKFIGSFSNYTFFISLMMGIQFVKRYNTAIHLKMVAQIFFSRSYITMNGPENSMEMIHKDDTFDSFWISPARQFSLINTFISLLGK